MKKINVGDIIALLVDVKSIETPFFANTGDKFSVKDIVIDPMMQSGYSVRIGGYGSDILVDKSAVVHYDDWKRIHNSVIKQVLVEGKL